MLFEVVAAREPLAALHTDERPFPRVPTDVCLEVGGCAVDLRTPTATAGLLLPQLLVSLDVVFEVVAAREPLAALHTDEPPFPRVPTDVFPEVGGLAVHLRTVGVVTDVFFLPRRAVRVGGLGVSPTGTVRAGAGKSTSTPESLLLRNGLKVRIRGN